MRVRRKILASGVSDRYRRAGYANVSPQETLFNLSQCTEIDMINEQLLDECIEEYNVLKKLDGITEQLRGQKFNALIAKILNAHQVYAISDQRNKGEIDVCFRIKDKRFILEAKWEKDRINMDPIAKLGLRINQRIPNNLGVILSMSGYTKNALQQMDQAGRPHIILLEQDVFDALLHANIDAEILFDACVDVAAFEGKLHITLSDIFKYMPVKNVRLSISSEIETEADKKVAPLLAPKGDVSEFRVIKTGLPFGQNGISVSGKIVFVTLINGLYKLGNKKFTKIYDIDNPQNRCIFDSEKKKMLFVKNNSVMAIDRKGIPISISKRYPGHVRIFKNNDAIHLISNGDDFSSSKRPVRVIEDIAGHQRELVFDYPISCCTDACFTEDSNCAIIGSSGLIFYQNKRRVWDISVLNGASVSYLNGKIYFLENGVSLKSIGLDGKIINNICEFDLPGSVGDFAIVGENKYIFHLCYHDGHTTKTAIVDVKAG